MGVALEAFGQLIARDDARIDLARACLMIAQDAYPGSMSERYLGAIERMAIRLRAAMPQNVSAEERVVALNKFLYEDEGFWGNTDDYYDPRNSYLNEVIDRKTGIPITLSILYMELGRRIGLPLEGVSFPGHFLVRLKLRGGVLVLDPFSGGAPQSEDDLRKRVKRVIPDGVADDLPAAELPLDQFLEPATNRQILSRVLRNLKGIYREIDKPERMLDVLNRMLLVTPGASAELRERGLVYHRLECYRAALQDLSATPSASPMRPTWTRCAASYRAVGALRPPELGLESRFQITRGRMKRRSFLKKAAAGWPSVPSPRRRSRNRSRRSSGAWPPAGRRAWTRCSAAPSWSQARRPRSPTTSSRSAPSRRRDRARAAGARCGAGRHGRVRPYRAVLLLRQGSALSPSAPRCASAQHAPAERLVAIRRRREAMAPLFKDYGCIAARAATPAARWAAGSARRSRRGRLKGLKMRIGGMAG
jgi:regulator of sirC expression with transglutaminase-like and TPR domain